MGQFAFYGVECWSGVLKWSGVRFWNGKCWAEFCDLGVSKIYDTTQPFLMMALSLISSH